MWGERKWECAGRMEGEGEVGVVCKREVEGGAIVREEGHCVSTGFPGPQGLRHMPHSM